MDSHVSLHVPPENPNPGPNDIIIEMNPKRTMSANIAMLPKMRRKPTIRALSPSDFSMAIISRTYETAPPPIAEGTTSLCEPLATGTELCRELPGSPAKKTAFSDLIPNASENQTIELKQHKIESKPMQQEDDKKSGSMVSPSSYFILPLMFIAKRSSMEMPARIAGPANFFQLIHSKH
jgi:hypothetical protein